MSADNVVARRSVLLGAAGAAGATATGLISGGLPAVGAGAAPAAAAPPSPWMQRPLWQIAKRRGLFYGTSCATWQISDAEYRAKVRKHANIVLPEDDLLWYQLKPTPDSPLDFTAGDKFFAFAERNDMRVLGAHLVWDEGFGEGWTDDDLWGLNRKQAEKLLYGTVRQVVRHYKGRADAWIVCNEVTDPEGVRGVRTNVPWYNTIGKQYIARSFRIAHQEDPKADLLLNEFGFETVNEWGDRPEDRRKAFLQVIDMLQRQDVPLHGVGIQAHLLADRFHERFDAKGYRQFLRQIADRGLKIFITEMDVLDDGLPKNIRKRDQMVADIYRRYLDVTLDSKAVKAVISFGLSDRYTWLQEDMPREDGAARRPLILSESLRRKPAYRAVRNKLHSAPKRRMVWKSLR
jgi:endo-1,4-beta-xylanase